ncbi:MAG: tetratricopeptide repeat protein [Selenomonadaceae bacterium]|nr:tetratricopeptide repeat protein [Selenomonadaceae bacterium]
MRRIAMACLALLTFLTICCLWPGAMAGAAPQRIEATGVYIMGDNDSPKIARDAARQEAMRVAVEKAGVYVESYSRTKNMQLTEDDVKMISGAVLKVIKEDSVPELAGTTWKYTVHLVAEVDTDNIDLKTMMARKNELEKLQQERDALKKQNEELLAEYQKANGQEKKKLGTRLESSYDYEKIFDRSMGYIQCSEYTRAIDELTTLIGDRAVKGNPRAYAYYLRGRAYYGLNRPHDALEDFSMANSTEHDNTTYPVWRCHQYEGLIYYDEGRYDEAVRELEIAWNYSDKRDQALADDLRTARLAAERVKNPQPQQQEDPGSGDNGRINWTKILTDIIIHSMDKGNNG